MSHICLTSLPVSASSDIVTVMTDKNIQVTQLAAKFFFTSFVLSLLDISLCNQYYLCVDLILPIDLPHHLFFFEAGRGLNVKKTSLWLNHISRSSWRLAKSSMLDLPCVRACVRFSGNCSVLLCTLFLVVLEILTAVKMVELEPFRHEGCRRRKENRWVRVAKYIVKNQGTQNGLLCCMCQLISKAVAALSLSQRNACHPLSLPLIG